MTGIELLGVDEMLRQVREKLNSAAARLENKALRAAGQVIAEGMQSHVNISDRQNIHLREDIKVSGVRRKEGQKYVLIGASRKTGWRGHFLEFGTSKMPAKPFVEPGFHEKKDEAIQIIADEYRKGLAR